VSDFLVGEYLPKLQARAWLSHARLAGTLLKVEESAGDNHVLACNVAKYSPILIGHFVRAVLPSVL